MHYKRGNFGILLVFVVIGLLIGSAVGELLAFVLPNGSVVEMFFTHPIIRPEFGPATINLIVASITFGFWLKVNIISVLGIIFSVVLLRRYLFFYR
ncbi:MAG: DUF4321 domain-containing protein [bacterium]